MSEQPTAAAQTAAPPPSHRQRPPRRRRAFASTLFGYDIFISFALGFSGRGTPSTRATVFTENEVCIGVRL